jgi:hypothetical protein
MFPPLIIDVDVIFVKGRVDNSGNVAGLSISQLLVKINTNPVISQM